MSEPIDIGTAARRVGVSAAALRLYERRGLLPKAARTASGYRQYTESDIERARMVRRARRAGLTLAQIACVLSSENATAAFMKLLRERLQTLEGEVHRLQRTHRHLRLWLGRREHR